MSELQFLLTPGMAPFSGALALVLGLLIVELVMSVVGASLMGDGADGPDFDGAGFDGADFDADFDLDAADFDAEIGTEIGTEIGAETDFAAGEPGDIDALDGRSGAGASAAGGIAVWLGFGKVPFILWMAGVLTAFGLSGYVLQSIASGVLGTPVNAALAAVVALVPGLTIGRWFANQLGRIVPKTETTAINRRSLGGRMGVIAQGTARRGKPAQARIRDGHGNTHYVRVEPVDDDMELPRGTEILIRAGRGSILFALPISDIPAQIQQNSIKT